MGVGWIFESARRVLGKTVAVMGVAGVLLAVAPLKGTYVDPKLPVWMYSAALWVALALLGILALAWLIDWFESFIAQERVEQFRSAKRDELQDILPLYDQIVGGDRPTINQLKEVFNANSTAFRFFERVTKKKGGSKIVTLKGFCTIVPMTESAAELLGEERLNGLRMDKTHVCPPNKKCKVVYIGSIGGDGPRCRAAVLNYVLGLISEFSGRGVERIYTRPVTVDGLRVARQYGFRPVKEDAGESELGRLYVLELDQDSKPTKRRVRPTNPG